MSAIPDRTLAIEPVISYPRAATPGEICLLTVDARLADGLGEWPYEQEEYPLHCMLDTWPLFANEPIGEATIILHRFGGTYGPATFLLTASDEATEGSIRLTLVNHWGMPVTVLELPDIRIGAADDPLQTAVERWYLGTAQAEDMDLLREAVQSGRLQGEGAPPAAGALTLTGETYSRLQQDLRPPTLHTLRAPSPDFTGREDEIEALLDALRPDEEMGKSAVIRGVGGVGKTELALAVAQRVAPHYPDAQLFFDLQPGGEPLAPEALLAGVIRAFEPQATLPAQPAELQALYRHTLQGRRGFLLLDNAHDPAQLFPLLPAPPGWAAVITSRERLELEAVMDFRLREFVEEEALTYLRHAFERGGRGDLVEAGVEALSTLALLCGYLPLALRLAAGFLTTARNWSLSPYLEALREGSLKWLTEGEAAVERVLVLSVRRLETEDPALATRWRLLGIFAGAFDDAAAAALWQADEGEAREKLSSLRRMSLLDYDPTTDSYWLHNLLRDYALAEPPPHVAEAIEAARRRHADHYLEVAREAETLYLAGGRNVLEGLRRFDMAWPQLQAAWAWMLERESIEARRWVMALPLDMPNVLDLRLTPRARIPLLELALDAARGLSHRQGEADALGNLANAYTGLGDASRAIRFHEERLAIVREIGDRRGESHTLGNLGLVYAGLGDAGRAIGLYEQALSLAREIGDRRGEATLLNNLSNALAAVGDARRAIGLYEQALSLAREIGDRRGEGRALNNLGNAYSALGEPYRAIDFYRQRLDIARELSDRQGEGAALGNLGNTYLSLGDARRAIDFYQQHLEFARELGDRRSEGTALGNLGNAYYLLGDYHLAIDFFEEALQLARELGDRHSEGTVLGNLGNTYLSLGDAARAIDFHQQQLQIARQIGDRRGEGNVLNNLGNTYSALGDPQQAIDLYQQSLRIAEEIGDRGAEANALGNLGIAYKNLGDARRAIDFYHQQLEIARAIGDRRGQSAALGNLGNAYDVLGRSSQAVDVYEEALLIAREIGDRRGEALSAWGLGLVHERRGDYRRAADLMELTVAFEREIGHPDAEEHAKRLEATRQQVQARSSGGVNTGGGAYFGGGSVETGGGVFAGRDQVSTGTIGGTTFEGGVNIAGGAYFGGDVVKGAAGQGDKAATGRGSRTGHDAELAALREQVIGLWKSLDQVISAGEIATRGQVRDLRGALEAAREELEVPSPDGERIVRKLAEAASILEKAAGWAEAEGRTDAEVRQLAPLAVTALQLAQGLFLPS